MGSLTSRPKAASQQQIVYTPTETTTASSSESTEADPAVIAKARAENVLRRSRSALGTVLTSFRGILSGNGNAPQRKSLLGE
jgi:hypothetical protein